MSPPRHSRVPRYLPLPAVPADTVRSGLRLSQEEVRYGRGVKIRRRERHDWPKR